MGLLLSVATESTNVAVDNGVHTSKIATLPNGTNFKCGVCEQPFEEREETKTCSGGCNTIVHFKCSNLTNEEPGTTLEGSDLLWFCDKCRLVRTIVPTNSVPVDAHDVSLNCLDEDPTTQKLRQQQVINEQPTKSNNHDPWTCTGADCCVWYYPSPEPCNCSCCDCGCGDCDCDCGDCDCDCGDCDCDCGDCDCGGADCDCGDCGGCDF